MRKSYRNWVCGLVLLFSLPCLVSAQTLPLSTGNLSLSAGNNGSGLQVIRRQGFFNDRYFYVARFAEIPSPASISRWQKENFRVYDKLDAQTYLVSSNTAPDGAFNHLHQISATAILPADLKISPMFGKGRTARFLDGKGSLAALVAFVPITTLAEARKAFAEIGASIDEFGVQQAGLVTVFVNPAKLDALAALPFVTYIQPIAKDKALNEKARMMGGAFKLNQPVADGGFGLKGKGVVIGVGDDGDPSFHPDLSDRIINRTPGIVNSHGAHVTGTIAGAGLLQPDRRGFAPMATIISQFFSGIWLNAGAYVNDFGMVLTNNSYSATEGDCDYNGVYDLYSRILDQQAFLYPSLLHVFAAGNSGDDVCSPRPTHYGTVLAAYQPSKNVITVGRTDYNQLSSGSSSSGPVRDGRLKPEISSLGIIESTNATNGYFGSYGTSMSAPTITGGLALLYERYRQLFGGSNPDGALMKSILLDGAKDIGNPGPDYRHGYGFLHLENSIRILNNHQYFGGSLATGGQRDSVITVPAGMAQLKVLVYWHDPAASPLAIKTLVNDLDLEVIGPDGQVVLPKKLNPDNPEANAMEGTDHINNSEQVVIDNPVAGNYTIRIKGYDVSVNNSQPFYTSFDYVPAGVFLRTPVKGDNWSVSAPDEYAITGVMISWDDDGTPAGTLTLEYSLDNGANWNLITNAQQDDLDYYGWRPPAGTATNEARVRITKNGTSYSSTSEPFTIIDRPVYKIASNPCPGYITVSWTAVTGADDYEVIMKKGPEMVPVVTVPNTILSYTISGLSKDSTYYVAVRARKGGISGRWIKANPTTPNSGSCTGNISDGDLKLDSIVSPIYGRQFTSTALGTNSNLVVRVKNLDNVVIPAGQFIVQYSLDGGPFIRQAGTTAIASLGTYTHTFSGVDLSATGTHTITAVVQNNFLSDKVAANDTFTTIIKNLPNAAVSLANPFTENFEAAPEFVLQASTFGLPGLDRWDYTNSDKYARARSFVNTGIAYSGNRAMTLDVSKAAPYVKNPANNLLATFNLENYTTASDVRFDIRFKHHGSGQEANDQNKIWIRGADTDKWVEAYDLGNNQTPMPGQWKRTASIELNDLLTAANPAQQFSSSLQVRIGQYAFLGMADDTHLAGYTFDDARLYIATNDMQLLAIDTPGLYSCGLNTAVPVKVTVRNTMNQALSNIPVQYSINGGQPVTETIPGPIATNASFSYQFAQTANLGTPGRYTVTAMVTYPGDNNPDNDTATALITNLPVISSFPYFENFENGNGNFTVSGLNPSWEFGLPASIKIDTAASGTHAWKTRLKGGYNDNEFSYLNTPCFNISGLADPMLSFSMAYDIEDCSVQKTLCDAAWMEYSTDGINWKKLGNVTAGTNWYTDTTYAVWLKRKQTHWHVASIPLPKGVTELHLRFVMASDDYTNYDGLAIDDIHIYDRTATIYTGFGTSPAVNLAVNGNSGVDFTSGGKIIASVLPANNNNLGTTETKAYIFEGPARDYMGQYYGNRNITIKPEKAISGNATVRFYFTDAEADSMRLATGCSLCPNPKDYTHLGVTQYTDANKQNEDGDITNNNSGISRFISGGDLTFMPYDAGYYAEFPVSEFSEFWLNDGKGINQPLPGRWLSFTAVKLANDVVRLNWATTNEIGISGYEIEVAASKEDFANNRFTVLGTAAPKNTSPADYSFLDGRAPKTGDYYYRIRQADSNGRAFYSPIVLVQFPLQDFSVTMYPNPVTDNLLLTVQAPTGRQMRIKVFNMAGQLLYDQQWMTNSGISQEVVPFSRLGISRGMYTVAITDGKDWWYSKVVKE